MNWLRHLVHPEQAGVIRILAILPRNPELERIAQRDGWQIEYSPSCQSAILLIERQQHPKFDVILCDRDAPNWRESIRRLAAAAPKSSVILTSPESDDHLWQDVIDCGGFDVLTKPFQTGRVVQLVQFAQSHPKKSTR